MTLTLLTPIILLVTATVVIISALVAYKSGLVNSIINLAVTVASAFCAALICAFGMKGLKSDISHKLLNSDALNGVKETLDAFTSILDIFVSVATALIIFIPVYIIILVMARVAVWLIIRYKKSKIKKSDDGNIDDYLAEDASYFAKNDKKIAIAVGAVCGLFMSIAVLSPVTGLFRVAGDVVDIIHELSTEEPEPEAQKMLNLIDEYSNDFTVTVYDACGGSTLFNVTTLFNYSGDLTNISSEIRTVKSLELSRMVDSLVGKEGLNDDMIATFKEIVSASDKSPLIKMLLTTFTNEMASHWLLDDSFMEVTRPEFTENDTVRDVVDEMLKVLADSTERTVCADIGTMLSLIDILSEYSDELSSGDYETLVDSLVSGKVIENIKKELAANPRMSVVEAVADDLVVKMVAEEIANNVKFTDEMRESIYEKIAEALSSTSEVNATVRTDLVSSEISDVLAEYGVYSTDGLSDKLAEMLVDELGARGGRVELSDIQRYFDSYLEAVD